MADHGVQVALDPYDLTVQIPLTITHIAWSSAPLGTSAAIPTEGQLWPRGNPS